MFQFTHPGGVRLSRVKMQYKGITVSIHAPGRGATKLDGTDGQVMVVSIHAPGRGATFQSISFVCLSLFQFTHPGGVRRVKGFQMVSECPVSIHAPGRGATSPTS